MNIKAYLFASLIVPAIGLIFIIVASVIDINSGYMDLEEIIEGEYVFLLFVYAVFVLACLITSFFILLFATLFKIVAPENNKRNFYLMSALVGVIVALVSLYLMESGNLTRDNGLHSLRFSVAGIIFGLFISFVYYRFKNKLIS